MNLKLRTLAVQSIRIFDTSVQMNIDQINLKDKIAVLVVQRIRNSNTLV